MSEDKKDIIGFYGIEGMKSLKIQLENNYEDLVNLINKKFMNNKIKNTNDILSYDENENNLKGLIFKKEIS